MRYYLFFFFLLFYSCSQNADNSKELQALQDSLFRYTPDVSRLPVFADPPTGDYLDVKKGIFSFGIDSQQIRLVNKYRAELEPGIIQRIDSGTAWVYLAAYLKYEPAVPKIKQALLKCDHFYGWEGGDYSTIDRYLEDEQYPYQMSYVAAIEYITGQPLDKAISLTADEVKVLTENAKLCVSPDSAEGKNCAARWLLTKMTTE